MPAVQPPIASYPFIPLGYSGWNLEFSCFGPGKILHLIGLAERESKADWSRNSVGCYT